MIARLLCLKARSLISAAFGGLTWLVCCCLVGSDLDSLATFKYSDSISKLSVAIFENSIFALHSIVPFGKAKTGAV